MKQSVLAPWFLTCFSLWCCGSVPALAQQAMPVAPPVHHQCPPTAAQLAGGLMPGGYRGIVFVANGAGDMRCTSEGFAAALADARLPWEVRLVPWAHNSWAIGWMDLKDRKHHKTKGQQLADEVLAFRESFPGQEICLCGHSAGCSVVLDAAEVLPPGTVDHLFLLAPAISTHYNLAPALRCSRCGIDVFFSWKDCFLLTLQLWGPPEHSFDAFAGRVGFKTDKLSRADAAEYRNLRNHPWRSEDRPNGHGGGHFGWTEKDYVRASILPLLLTCDASGCRPEWLPSLPNP